MSHREVLQALSGLLMGLFVAMLSSTVVSSSLPKIIADLGGGQSAYTWVVTSTLLATTVSTPIWGKLADLFNRKLLVQLALGVFVLGSALAGISSGSGELIVFRVLQGLGAGGLTALATVIMADIISPRERGRYMGLMGAVMAVATVGGPLLGGLVTDSVGWRYNFYVGVPFAVIAIVLLQRTLHLPTRRRSGLRIDYLGTALIAGSVSLLLVWVTLGGHQIAWNSTSSYLMVIGAAVLAVAFVVVESRAAEPILPLALFRNRTFLLAVIASLAVGVAMFGTSVFLSQYMQLARGKTPTVSGLLTTPMVAGLLISSTVIGQLISRTGIWKRYLVAGAALLVTGLALMGSVRADTNWFELSAFMFVTGAGVGMVMQNLVLVVQNTLSGGEMGAGTSAVAFFRSLGGAIGVSVMGAVLGTRVTTLTTSGLTDLGVTGANLPHGSSAIPDLATLPTGVRGVIEGAYGEAIGNVFLLAAPLAVITLIAVALLPNRPLGEKTALQQELSVEQELVASAEAAGGQLVGGEPLPLPDERADAEGTARPAAGRSAAQDGSSAPDRHR